ncbi:MAG: M48 family metalloprotease [Gammaproteobacteria bacterium]|nr:M48 family metalloprotease [Gammaproteobacteria bacterium]
MNFFAHQERARRATTLLFFLFVLATLGVVVAVNLVGIFFMMLFDSTSSSTLGAWVRAHSSSVIWMSLCTVSFIGITSLVKTSQYSRGGSSVAQALGATWVSPHTSDPMRRRLCNIVEEISVASGIPVPQIYILEREYGINAFTAGFSSADAVIVVTRSAIELLDRDELQGVIAHEFSHILNGDMRLNMRLIGLLFGMIAISEWGHAMLRSADRAYERYKFYPRGEGLGGVGILICFGICLLVVGGIGTIFGSLLRAAVLRQRELLADAAAVQFTRNSLGIVGALKKIAAWRYNSRVYAANSGQVSHMLIAESRHPWDFWFATHPPLNARIRLLDRSFDPSDLIPLTKKLDESYSLLLSRARQESSEPENPPSPVVTVDTALGVEQITTAINPASGALLGNASALYAAIPILLLEAAHSSRDAVVVILGLVLSQDEDVRARQIESIGKRLNSTATAHVAALGEEISALGPRFRLPLFNIALPAIKRRPRE